MRKAQIGALEVQKPFFGCVWDRVREKLELEGVNAMDFMKEEGSKKKRERDKGLELRDETGNGGWTARRGGSEQGPF